MQAFTPVESWGKGGQDGDAANELIVSYFEHRKILGQAPSGYALLPGGYAGGDGSNAQRVLNNTAWGGDGQGKNVFQEIQDWLETYCTSFLNTSTLTSFLNDDKTAFVNYTKAAWQAEAGLNVSDVSFGSFRRKVNIGDAWSYGTELGAFLPGDIRGPWCFEDIQNGLKALKWTKEDWVSSNCQGKNQAWEVWPYNPPFIYNPTTIEEYRQQFIDAWNVSSWSGQHDMQYRVGSGFGRTDYYTGEFKYNISSQRYRFQQTGTYRDIPRKFDLYIFPNDQGATQYDFDSLGVRLDEYGLVRSSAIITDTTYIHDWFITENACPLTIVDNGNYEAGEYVLSEKPFANVIKWQFTYGED